jgi:hypothetical protein
MNTLYNYDATYESPYQAWRTGFINAVIICLGLDSEDLTENIDYDNLNLWLNVGRDVNNGAWAIAGAQQGTYMSLLTQWDHSTVFKGTEVNEKEIDALWQTVVDSNPDNLTALVSQELVDQLDLTVVYMDARVSKFFKHYVLSNTQ